MAQKTADDSDSKWLSARILELVKFLSAVKGDLANVSAPPSFLAPSSVVEVGQCWAERPDVFVAPALEDDPKLRALLVLRLFLVALRTQLYIGGAPNLSIKKPLNAFLGELFLASWSSPKSQASTRLVSEQVSHHPPITAMHISSPEHGIRADGYARVEMTFSNTVNIRQIGHAVLHVDEFDEDYLIPLPDVQVRGFLSACLYPEIQGKYTIMSSTGYVSEIDFSGQGVFRGKKNSFQARVYRSDDTRKKSLYEVFGIWSKGWETRDCMTGKKIEQYDVDRPENQPAPMNLDRIEDQDPWESRRAWHDVSKGLQHGDFRRATKAKQQLEEAQRRMRAEEMKQSVAWEPLFFRSLPGEDHEVFHNLAQGTNWSISDSQTKGVWRLNDERLHTAAKPYRQVLTPHGTAKA